MAGGGLDPLSSAATFQFWLEGPFSDMGGANGTPGCAGIVKPAESWLMLHAFVDAPLSLFEPLQSKRRRAATDARRRNVYRA